MSRQTSTKKNAGPEPLLSETWAGSWFTRPAAWCILAWCIAALLWKLAVPLWVVILGGLAAAVIAPMVATGLDMPLRGRQFHFVLWLLMGAYGSWVVASTPLQRDVFLAWPFAGAPLGAWWWWLRHLTAVDRARGADKHAAAEKDADRGEYVAVLERVLKKKPGTSGITKISQVPFEAGVEYGETITLQLPADGSITYERLDAMVPELVTAADARKGSLVFEEDPERGRRVKLHVAGKDALGETRPLPFDRGPKSIHDPIALGQYADGGIAVVTFREIAAMLVGIKGSGKSSLINTHLAHLTGCVDALVWMIDLKGMGETALPWVEPFLEATTGRPALDWLAVDEYEADLLLNAVKAGIQGRKTKKVDPSREKPAIILVVEEASLVTGVGKAENIRRAGLMQDGVTTGRSKAFDSLICSQRGTVTMLGNGDMTSNLDVRYGMRVQDRQDGAMIFPESDWSSLLMTILKTKAHRGVFLMQGTDHDRKMLAKSHWVDPANIAGMAITNAQYQPELDDETLRAVETKMAEMGVPGGYASRWDRLREALGYPVREAVQLSHGVPHQVPHDLPHNGPRTLPHETPEDRGLRLVNEAIAADRSVREAAASEASFEAITGHAWDEAAGVWRETELPHDMPTEERDDPDVIPPILRHLVAVFAGRAEDKLPTRVILEHLPGELTATKLGRLANICGFTSIENIADEEAPGGRARGYAQADVLRALSQARLGKMPKAAFDWVP